jgi:HD-GYP domain-containing protein (c-di-GMP phosphodiesterase class II)
LLNTQKEGKMVSCSINLLFDQQLSIFIDDDSEIRAINIDYAYHENMMHSISASCYDAIFLSYYDDMLLSNIRKMTSNDTKIVLISNTTPSSTNIDYIIKKPFNNKISLKHLNRIAHIQQMIKVCQMISIMKKLLSLSSQDASKQADRIPLIVKKMCHYIYHDQTNSMTYHQKYFKEVVAYSAIHDIGKIGISYDLLNYPGIFDDNQRKIMRNHVDIGVQIYQKIRKQYGIDFSTVAYNIIKYHHEHYDGNGYPSGMSSLQIPLEARIICVADVYDALMSDRVYKDKTNPEKVVEILISEKGKHFDPYLIDIILKHHDELKKMYD